MRSLAWTAITLAWAFGCARPLPDSANPELARQASSDEPPAPLGPPSSPTIPASSASPEEPPEPRRKTRVYLRRQLNASNPEIIEGTPRLLRHEHRFFEWRSGVVIARPRLLADIGSSEASDMSPQYLGFLRGRYPDRLYAQRVILRQAVRKDAALLRWNGDEWRPVRAPLSNSPTLADLIVTNDSVLAVGCEKARCQFSAVEGAPTVPRFSWKAGCKTRIGEVVDVATSDAGEIFVLGTDCKSGELLVEHWAKGATQGKVEVVRDAKPRPEGFEPIGLRLQSFDDEIWVWGLEWFWGGGPVTQALLAPRRGGSWPVQELPCDSGTPVSSFASWNKMDMAICGSRVLLRSPEGAVGTSDSWSAIPDDVEAVTFQWLGDQLLVVDGDETVWLFEPPDSEAIPPPQPPTLPCAGFAIPLAAKTFAEARTEVEALGSARKEFVLGGLDARGHMVLITPDEASAVSAKATLGHPPSSSQCFNERLPRYERPEAP